MAITRSKLGFPGGWSGLALAGAAALFAASCIPGSVRNGPVGAGPTRVTGTLVVASGGSEIEIPDAKVFLTGPDRRRAGETLTQLDGRFELVAPLPGIYRLCYEAGPVRGCGPRLVALGPTLSIGSVAVLARASISGRVLTGDGRPCWMADSFFGLDVSTEVRASRAGGVRAAASARANTEGEYALFGLGAGSYEVTASCEAAHATRTVAVAGAPVTADFGLPNHAPVIQMAAAYAGATGRTSATTGETLAVRADVTDPEGDTIQYLWRGLPQAGVAASTGATMSWHLPATPGLYSAYLIARDGRGGYAYRRVDMEVAARRTINLSGLAIDETTGRAIGNAVVTVGEASTRTNADGWFSLETAPRDDSRYVVNIRHPNYALMSRVLDGSARGASYGMTAAQVSQVAVAPASAGGTMQIVDRASAGFCGTAGDARAQPLVWRTARQTEGEGARDRGDEDGGPREEQPCARRGAEIVIPAGALVNGRGEAASGNVRAAITTLNPARRALPGDYSAIARNGATVALLSYGAVDAQFTDAAGAPLNLRPGTTAEVRIPVPPSQAAGAPPTMAMWSYDSERGRWIEEGQAALRQEPGGPVYVGRTSHFSTINIDLPGWTAANVTCLRVELDAGFNAWSNKVLRAYVSYGGNAVQVREATLDNSLIHAVYTIPWGTTLPHNTVRLEIRGTLNNTTSVLLSQIVDTDALPQMTFGQTEFPPWPYTPCPGITLAPPGIPYYGDDAAGRPAFLGGPAGTINPINPDTVNYYAQLDQSGSNPTPRTTLGDWWAANGFDGNTGASLGGTNDAIAAYTNYNDLGFGRDMHCLERSGGRLACYVTNYGLPDQSGSNADAADQHLANLRGATVTMEYEPSLGANAVRFYVYGGGVFSSPRINYADLDGLGPKPVPYLCTVCHGGYYAGHDVAQARFREFDLPSFLYPANRHFDYSGNYNLLATEIASFAQLNEMVRNAQPGILPSGTAPTPIRALIDSWYQANGGFTGAPDPTVTPSGWNGSQADKDGYHNVYARSCRTCHIARDGGYSGQPYTFETVGNFQASFAVKSYVCGGSSLPAAVPHRVMPNAYVTYRNFWADPQRPGQFATLVNITPPSLCGP